MYFIEQLERLNTIAYFDTRLASDEELSHLQIASYFCTCMKEIVLPQYACLRQQFSLPLPFTYSSTGVLLDIIMHYVSNREK